MNKSMSTFANTYQVNGPLDEQVWTTQIDQYIGIVNISQKQLKDKWRGEILT